MAIGIAAVLVILAVVFFVRQAGGEQRLYPDYIFNFSPLKTSAEVKQDVFVPVDTVWKKFTDISNYHLWFPWIKKIRVTHEDVNRWVLKHATDRYQPEVGRYFHVQPFFGAPYTKCRYIGIEQNKSLVLEMRFFPFCKELVTFTLTSYSNCVELSYKLKSSGLLSPISAFMFSWRGKSVLHNLVGFIPPVQEVEITTNGETKTPEIIMDDSFVVALVAKAMSDGDDILNKLTEKKTRGKAKSALFKAKRKGETPQVTAEAAAAVEQFLSGGQAAPAVTDAPATPAGGNDVETLVQNALETGNMEPINNISDKILRGKAKSALVKAKRKKG
jgi:hypothetical protein